MFNLSLTSMNSRIDCVDYNNFITIILQSLFNSHYSLHKFCSKSSIIELTVNG